MSAHLNYLLAQERYRDLRRSADRTRLAECAERDGARSARGVRAVRVVAVIRTKLARTAPASLAPEPHSHAGDC